MKKSNLFFSAVMALAGGVLAGCSDDLATDNQIQTVDHDQVRYLNVTISSPTGAGTRAASFLEGTPGENFVKNMTFVFYDAKGFPTGQAYDKNFTLNGTDQGFEDQTGSVDKIWTSTVPVTLAQGDNMPAYVVCFINSLGIAELKTKSMAELDDVLRQMVVRTDEEKEGEGESAITKSVDYFPMTNAVYYGTNKVTGETYVRTFAAPILTGQLYTSATDASAANAKTVEIYVERYAARVELDMAPAAIADNTTSVNGYTLKFVPEYWRPNAIDQNIYAVKRFGLVNEANVANYDPKYSDLVTNFDGKIWWNDDDNFRSYWGCSPSYYTNEYPEVSDDITDVAANNDYSGTTDDTKYPYDLHYFNYNQIASSTVTGGVTFRFSIPWHGTNGFNQVYYARETTTASRAWGYRLDEDEKTSYNPLASIPSAVIVGHYELTRTNAALASVPENQRTFYLYGKTPDGKMHNLYFDSNIQQAMVDVQRVVLLRTDKTEGDVTTTTYSEYRGAAGWKIEHPSKAVRDVRKVKVAGRLVALQLDADNLPNNLYYYDATAVGEKYVPITAGNVNIVNSNLIASASYATKYGDGIAYFNIPIEHLGIYNDAGTGYVTGAKTTTNGIDYDFKKCPAGSFGIVRNHAYNIEVTKISGLGTALRDKTQPIVPPVNDKEYFIAAKLNILNWRIVPKQTVEL